ncbi:MAG: type I-E CRISPR-associated protein Cas5/CasD [Phycisphaerae bacterium]|nr:type I-E CRISPR-associated protein Cas5/CasD [Phycisphaerae bacterium]
MTTTRIESGETSSLYLRLEGPMQSWGSRAIGRVRRTEAFPTKSGVIGLLGAALGLTRRSLNSRLVAFNALTMAVRIDRAGRCDEDYQTVGAGIGILSADGKIKRTGSTGEVEAIISPREFLFDASFLVVLQGEPQLIRNLAEALRSPIWPLYLGRKRCVPSEPIYAGVRDDLDLPTAIKQDGPEDRASLPLDVGEEVRVVCDLLDVDTFSKMFGDQTTTSPSDFARAKVYLSDRIERVDPPVHTGRVALDFMIPRPDSKLERPDLTCPYYGAPPTPIEMSGMVKAKKAARDKAGPKGVGRCIFCHFVPNHPKNLHAHHITYRRHGRETVTEDHRSTERDDLVMLCNECHAAVTMIEYQRGYGIDRVDPRNPMWQHRIFAAREQLRRNSPISVQPVGAHTTECELIESTIPLLAGDAYDADSPGNRWIANRQHVHQRLSMAFPEVGNELAARGYGVERDKGSFSFRIQRGTVVSLLVRSHIRPDWFRAFNKSDWLVANRLPPPRPMTLAQYVSGSEWNFELEANPVKRLRTDGPEGRKGQRVGLRGTENLETWLKNRAVESGFALIDGTLTILPIGRIIGKPKRGGVRQWDGVEFAGRLRVTEAERFVRTLAAGIGPAKAFGFGLLSIAPL